MIRKIYASEKSQTHFHDNIIWQTEYAQNWFKANLPFHGRIWMADDSSLISSGDYPPLTGKTEIVLTGNFFRRLLESRNWQIEEFRLWTFSERINEFLAEEFKIPREQIGLIGRKCHPPLMLPDFKSELSLVYSGSLSLTKNITSILRLVSLLQVEHGVDVTLDIFGEYEDFKDESIGKYEISSIREVVEGLMRELPWKAKPVFHGKVNQGEWLNIDRSNPHYINLTSSMYEDFGIEAYMASEKGWPCILSDWGGHGEAGNAYIIPMNLIARTHEPAIVQESKSKILAEHLVKGIIPSEGPADDISFVPQRYILKKELHDLMNEFIAKYYPEILLCLRNQLDSFADTPKGITFFRKYHEAFGEKQAQEAFIINDEELHVGFKFAGIERGYDIISLRDLKNPFYLQRFGDYEKIIIVEPGINVPETINFLRETLKLNVPITIFTVPGSGQTYLLSSTDEVRELAT